MPQQPTWYTKLTDDTDAFFDDTILTAQTEEAKRKALHEFVTTIAKEQYALGNRAGIAWILQKRANEM